MTVVLNIRNEWKQEDGPNPIHWHTRVLHLPSTEAKVTTSPTCFSQPFIRLDREASRRSCNFCFCRWGDQGGEVPCVSVNWVWSILLFPFISYVQHNSHPYLPFLFRINFFRIIIIIIIIIIITYSLVTHNWIFPEHTTIILTPSECALSGLCAFVICFSYNSLRSKRASRGP